MYNIAVGKYPIWVNIKGLSTHTKIVNWLKQAYIVQYLIHTRRSLE